jgi:tetratricopeptide (TPR) repeat protein
LVTDATVVASEPYLPTSDDEVLETLPRDLLSSQDDLASLRRRLADNPQDAGLAQQVASRYLQIGKSSSDPRYYGYAQAALQPWWDATDAPPEILRVRSKLKERDHRYDEALADLQLLLDDQPRDLQAWMEVANIYGVQGKYAEAQNACDRLSELAGSAPAILCSAPLLALTGRAEEAYSSLAGVLSTVKQQWPAAEQWVITMQAEISRALGHDNRAEQHFRDALANDPGDYYLLRSYADFLLDHDRDKEVVSLLREHVSDTGVLLRAALAAARTGERGLASQWKAQLQSRFDENRLRGNPPHGQFEARFHLDLCNDPRRALEIAQANWHLQKQPLDSRVLLEAAIAAKDQAAARPVLEFLKKHGTQDVVLEQLTRQLEPR